MSDEGSSPASGLDGLRSAVHGLVPQRLLTWLMLRLTRVAFPPWKSWQIRWFIKRYGVDVAETLSRDPHDYEHFNAFFTRALRPGCRPIDARDDTLVCPADGRLSAIGEVRAGTLVQAKGRHYSLHDLLAGDNARTRSFDGGHFATIYLAPQDYHRVHMPLDGRLSEMTYVPGRLFSVNLATARAVPDLFTRNERLVCLFETRLGPMAVILVGALLVAGLETVWSGPLTPPHDNPLCTWQYADERAIRLSRGEEMGRFNAGSTVIVLLPAGRVAWFEGMVAGQAVRMGEALGSVAPDLGESASAAER